MNRDLVEQLIEKQREAAESNPVFAARLGISRQAWDQLRDGKIRPGPRTLRGVMATFPDLQGLAMSLFLNPIASKRAEADSTVAAEQEREQVA